MIFETQENYHMKSKNKEFDSVSMMREIRDELSKKYNNDPSFSDKKLKDIKKKYATRLRLIKKQKAQPLTRG